MVCSYHIRPTFVQYKTQSINVLRKYVLKFSLMLIDMLLTAYELGLVTRLECYQSYRNSNTKNNLEEIIKAIFHLIQY